MSDEILPKSRTELDKQSFTRDAQDKIARRVTDSLTHDKLDDVVTAIENITVSVEVDNVTVSNEVEIKNDIGNPVPVSNSNLPPGAATETTLSSVLSAVDNIESKLDSLNTELLQKTEPTDFQNVQAINLDTRDLVFASDKVDVSGSSVSVSSSALPSGASTSALQTAGNASLSSIDSKLTSPLTVTGPLTDSQLRASAVPVSASSLPLPAGASTSANQTTTHTKLDTLHSDLLVVEGKQDTGNASLSSIDSKTPTLVSGRQPVDGSGVTQPVSAVSLPLPTGAATAALQTQPGVDIGDVTINNASGAGAVNIQDGGNSITVDGTISANQSGTWNINNVSGTVSLPTGASTLAEQQTQTASLSVMDDWDESDRAKVNLIVGQAGVQGSTGTATANTQRVALATDANHIRLQDVSANGLGSNTSTPTLADRALPTRPIPYEPEKYAAAANGFVVAATPTDVFRIVGSGSKTIRVKKMTVSGRTTSGSPVPVIIKVLKYSTANTGGTSVSATVVPMDSNNTAGTATVNHYTANPTLGTLVGNIATRSITFQAAGLLQVLQFEFETPIVLRGTSQQLSINFNSTSVTGSSICCDVEWEEV